MLHSILQGNGAASGQCCEKAGHRWSVSLPRASLFGNFLVCSFFCPLNGQKYPKAVMCAEIHFFFQGQYIIYVVPCLYGLLQELQIERGSVFVCMHYSHASSIQKYSSTYFFSQSSMLTVFQRIFQNILAQTKRSCLQDPQLWNNKGYILNTHHT